MIYLSSVFIGGSIALILGIILAVCDRFLSSYPDFSITINSEKEITVPGGENLLCSLFSKKYFVPSACGGKGTCGYCKVKLQNCTLPILATEKILLTSDEIEEGWRLACQIKVKSPLEVWMPPEYFAIREYLGEIESSEIIATDIREINISLKSPETINFLPGQYVQIHIPEDNGIAYRSYSIASAPSVNHRISLNIKLEFKGLGSSYLHSLVPGDSIAFSGPYGDFLLSENNIPVVLIAGGVGLAPIMSILDHFLSAQTNRSFILFFKVKMEDEFYYLEKLNKLKETYSTFKFHLVVSDIPETHSFENGLKGRITKVLEPFMENFSQSEFYLCGSPVMINGIIDYLQTKTISMDNIFYDKFE